MATRSHMDWPFFESRHRTLATEAAAWAATHLTGAGDTQDLDRECRRLVADYGAAGFLKHAAPRDGAIDVRSVCICREAFAQHSGLAEFVFAMQGLGSGPISFFGSDALRAEYLPRVASGKAIAAFAISEREAGSDLGAMTTTARVEGSHAVIDGEKSWISNAGVVRPGVSACLPERRQCTVIQPSWLAGSMSCVAWSPTYMLRLAIRPRSARARR